MPCRKQKCLKGNNLKNISTAYWLPSIQCSIFIYLLRVFQSQVWSRYPVKLLSESYSWHPLTPSSPGWSVGLHCSIKNWSQKRGRGWSRCPTWREASGWRQRWQTPTWQGLKCPLCYCYPFSPCVLGDWEKQRGGSYVVQLLLERRSPPRSPPADNSLWKTRVQRGQRTGRGLAKPAKQHNNVSWLSAVHSGALKSRLVFRG